MHEIKILRDPLPQTTAPPSARTDPHPQLVFDGRDEWQAAWRRHLLPLQCLPADPLGFSNDAVVADLCGSRLAEIRVDASRLVRRDADIAEGGDGPVQVLWQLGGRSRIRQGPDSATLDAGAWTICDTGLPYAIDFEHGARCLLILVARSQCGGWLAALEVLAAQALPGGGPADIARTMLVSLLREGAHLDGRSQRALRDAVAALVEQALRIELDRRGLSAQASRSVSVARVQAYILDHLGDATLTVQRVAAVFGISRRKLYNMFAPAGVSPHKFIQDAKLHRARELLGDPDWRGAPITSIAEQCGFAGAAHFTRAFHAHHGSAPSAWRERSD